MKLSIVLILAILFLNFSCTSPRTNELKSPSSQSNRVKNGEIVTKRKDGTVYRTKSKNWYGAFQCPTTRRRIHVCLGVPDKSAAQQLLAKRIVEARLDSDGLGDQFRQHPIE